MRAQVQLIKIELTPLQLAAIIVAMEDSIYKKMTFEDCHIEDVYFELKRISERFPYYIINS